MSYRIFQPFFRSKSGGEYVSYPKYRTHHCLDGDQQINKSQKANFLQNGPLYKAHNVQGAFGDYKNSSSSCGRLMGSNYAVYRCHMTSFRDYNATKNNDLLNFDEKRAMQSLNVRLESYLENVKSLEEENVLLEKNICDWYEENKGLILPDCSHYFSVITDLQNQVRSARAHNVNLSKDIENGQMTADGCRKSYEKELIMRTKAEEVSYNHYGLLENMKMEIQALDSDIQHLEQEFLQLKKRSEEEMICLQAQLGTRVNVEVEPAPSIDLNAALSEIRNEYETLMERNLNNVEKMFQEMTSKLSLEVSSDIEQLQLSNNELTELKLSVHTLEAELKKQLNIITARECTLAEIHENYGSDISHLQGSININESHLADIQSSLRQVNYEYNVYKDLKTSLEKEIDTYKSLLEVHDTLDPIHHFIEETDGKWRHFQQPYDHNALIQKNQIHYSSSNEKLITDDIKTQFAIGRCFGTEEHIFSIKITSRIQFQSFSRDNATSLKSDCIDSHVSYTDV